MLNNNETSTDLVESGSQDNQEQPLRDEPRDGQADDNSIDETPENNAAQETPEWFMKDKYKSIEEQARSAFELQKKMGKYWGSPKENYDVEGLDGIEKDDPLVNNLAPALKEMGISQEGFKHLVSEYTNANKKMLQQFEDELKKELTQNDAHTYKAIEKWMGEHLTPEESQTIKNNWLMTATDFKLFNTLRLMAAPNTSVPNSNQSSVRFESSKEVENDKIKYRKEIKEGIRVADKNYENELASRFRDARARELRGHK